MQDNLKLIVLNSSYELGTKVNEQLNYIRSDNKNYIVGIKEERFSNGEGKIVLDESVLDKNIYIIGDIGNYSCTYNLFGYENRKGPDDHFQDIKRVVLALKGKAASINVVMPLLYSSRQHKKEGTELSWCEIALLELERLGVNNIITFDIHDSIVQKKLTSMTFKNIYPTASILNDFANNENIDYKNLIVVSPDSGAIARAKYCAELLKIEFTTYVKERDLSVVIDGNNPIINHEYLGEGITGKDIIVVDDMIDTGNSMLGVIEDLKKRGANKIYVFVTFALFTKGVDRFNEFYKNGLFNKIYATNLTYVNDIVKNSEWFHQVDCSTSLAEIIDRLDKNK